VTSSRRDHFNIIHARTNLLPFFAFVIAEGDYQFSKPAPDPYLAALARSQLKPEQCIVIEDSERGLRAAHAAGIRCLMFENALNTGADLSQAHGILKNIGELLDFIS
jgi:beta-phosphoglucomutase-like phosphatase (HAD superfamily)